ncbi:MAG: class I lanthipeptide [Candidatus Symbiothrix sp.]|jgi:hypothetical protein|nr:class I lanthipeptide [Candidatus Symbiothrix sp.]
MEKRKKKLIISKEVISSLNDVSLSNVKGGAAIDWEEAPDTGVETAWWTGGCSDGCGGSLALCTWLRCTNTACTADCGTNACDTGGFCTC